MSSTCVLLIKVYDFEFLLQKMAAGWSDWRPRRIDRWLILMEVQAAHNLGLSILRLTVRHSLFFFHSFANVSGNALLQKGRVCEEWFVCHVVCNRSLQKR